MSLTAAISTLKRFFANNPTATSLTLDQLYASAKRNSAQPDKNKSWVGNKLTHLKHYGLANPTYSYDPRKTLSGVELTYEGKKALGLIGVTPTLPVATSLAPKTITLESIAQDIKEFRSSNPSIKLQLIVEVKEE